MTIIQAQPLKQFGISGPTSALDNEVPVFDGITGKKIKAATGIICPSPGRLELSSTAPYLILHNTAHEDTDYGRESELIFKGEQSGGEETTLSIIQVAHDGTADDQKGIMSFKVNDGNDADAPGTAMTILANGNVGIGTTSPDELLTIGTATEGVTNKLRLNGYWTGVGARYMEAYVDHNGFTYFGGNSRGFKFEDPFIIESSIKIKDNVELTMGEDNDMALGYNSTDDSFQIVDGQVIGTNVRMVIDNAGNLGIGTTSPATSAKLELSSTTGALLLSRMTTAQRDALTAVNGMVLYNLTTNKIQGHENGAWANLI